MLILLSLLLSTLFISSECIAQSSSLFPPKVPPDQLEALRELKGDVPLSKESIELGNKLYNEKGVCFACHGREGRVGEGINPKVIELNPPPTDLKSSLFHKTRSDGELFWVIRMGIKGTGMPSFGGLLSELETWHVVNYIRSFRPENQLK